MNQQHSSWNNQQPWQQPQNGAAPLNDQELAFDLLYQEKALIANLASEVLEVSQSGMRQVMNDCYQQIGQDQLAIFQLMQQNGWYETKPAQPNDVQTAKQKYQAMRGTL